MSNPIPTIDITNPEALAKAAEEVSKTRRRTVVTRAEEALAMLVPIPKRRTRRRDVVAETAGAAPARQPAPTAEQLRDIATDAIAKEAVERMGD
jgi:hypothetical protein